MSVKVVEFSSAQNVGKRNPLNPLGLELRKLIWETLDTVEKDPKITSIVLTGGSNNFSAGADLTEFGSMKMSDLNSTNPEKFYPLPDLVNKIENFQKPIIAAITGVALGGGCEVALSCHYRISDNSKATKFGLPEVHVGVIPGAGGTQRLPRLIGLKNALEFILSGKSMDSSKALKLGLVDHVWDAKSGESLVDCAKKWAKWAELMPLTDRRVGQLKMRESRKQFDRIISLTRKKLPSVKRGGEGVHAAFDAIKNGCLLPLKEGMEIELDQFLSTLVGEQGIARRHAFFAIRQASKPVQSSVAPQKNHPLLTKTQAQVAVIGGGLMGSGIALVLLQAGFMVYLVDIAQPALDKGAAFIKSTIQSYVKRGKLTTGKGLKLQESLRPTLNMTDLKDCALVVEAVIENLNIKKKIFSNLDKITKQDAILCTNTSTLDIDKMAEALAPSRRGNFAGLHFFSPAHVMKLVEIVHGKATSLKTISLLQTLCKRLKKTSVVVGNCDGFVGNRLLISYGAESSLMLEEGVASVEKIDNALREFGMVMGVFQMGDLAGLDIGYNIRKERGWVRLSKNDPVPVGRPDRYPELADDICSQLGRLGQKVGKGWYDYDPKISKGRKGIVSKEVTDCIHKYVVKKVGKSPSDIKQFNDDQIIERLLFPLVNEGFKCLEEDIARFPSDVDVVYLFGYGFPSYKGGPMYWADHIIGLDSILHGLKKLSKQFPSTPYYVPSALLEKCVSMNITVTEYYKKGFHLKHQDMKNVTSRL